MRRSERNPAVEILRIALGVAWLPFAWAGAAPAAALRRYRASIAKPERARFDTRQWTAELLKHLEWRRIQGGRKYWGCLNYPRCKQTFPGTA